MISRATALRALGSWAPVALMFGAILMTLPYGTFIAHTLYRVGPEQVTNRVALPAEVVELVTLPSGHVVRFADGRVGLFDAQGARGAPHLAGPCRELGHMRGDRRVVCALGCEGVAILEADSNGDLQATALEPGGEATSGAAVGARVLVGTADGRIVAFDDGRLLASVDVGAGPVVKVLDLGTHWLAAVGTELVFVTAAAPEVVSRVHLGAPVLDMVRASEHYYALTTAEIVKFDLADPVAPLELARATPPRRPIALKPSLDSVLYVVLEGGGAAIVRDLGVGPLWWGRPSPYLADATACGGAWGGLACASRGDGFPEIRSFDIVAWRQFVVGGVGVLGAAIALSLVGSLLWSRPPDWTSRLAWLVIGLAALGWMLSGTLHTPVEAPHVLEYGALGLLLYRALTCEAGAGAAAAVVLGLTAGLLDETLQHLHPRRTGAVADVWLDGRAAAVGIGLGWLALRLNANRPPLAWRWPIWAFAALIPGLLGLHHASAGFGFAREAPGLSWTSGVSERRSRARAADPAVPAALIRAASAEYNDSLRDFRPDPYLYELRVRLHRRDMRMVRDDPEVACAEARVIDIAFQGVTDGTPFSWGEAESAACAGVGAGPGGDPGAPLYVSPVGEGRVTALPAWAAWMLAFLASIGLVGAGVGLGRRGSWGG